MEKHYIAVRWLHTLNDEPIQLISELDADGWETRKIEIYRDGTMCYASIEAKTGVTALSTEPIPSIEAINADPQFQAIPITKECFEQYWSCAVR